MRGFTDSALRRRHDVAVEFYSRAIEVLNWGRIAWKDVPQEKRGAIFSDTFVRGVKDLHLTALMQVGSSGCG